MADEESRGPWLRIVEPPHGVISPRQEEAIREYARMQGFETLRGFASRLRMMEWDYYDVLQEVSPGA
jgi:hypothetical protein